MKNPGLKVIGHERYRRMPWRNGRGSTLEIARDPAGGEEFNWRLSLARIEQDGAFSAYPGYGRALVLVAGSRLHLRFRGHGRALLDPTRPATRFEGDWDTACSIPQGPCTDLSLIVRRGSLSRSASLVRAPVVLNVRSARRVPIFEDHWAAVFVLGGSAAVGDSMHGRKRTLHELDTLLLSPGRALTLTLHNVGPSPARLVVLRWRPGRSSGGRPTRARRRASATGPRAAGPAGG